MNGLPYYKRYPRDFIEGTIGMPFEMKAAYGLILDLIYMQGGTLPDDSRYISGLLGCSVKKWNALRALLLDAGKIEVRGEHLGNLRADKELETLGKLQDKQRENRSRPNKNKTLPSPRFDHTEPDTDKDSVEAKASPGSDAADDPVAVMFRAGRALLAEAGVNGRQAGSLLGKWRKAHGEAAVITALGRAKREGAIDPVAFIEGCFRATSAKANEPAYGEVRTRPSGEQVRFVGGQVGWERVYA